MRRRALAAGCYHGPTFYLGPAWTACAAQLRGGARMCDLSGQASLGADGDRRQRQPQERLELDQGCPLRPEFLSLDITGDENVHKIL